jgi:hypothetical protein
MARTLPSALSAEFNADELRPFYAVELLFDSGDLRFWTGYGDITANSETWTGSGTVITFSSTNEATDLSANGMVINLTGLDTAIISIMLSENYRGRLAKIYLGALDSTNQPVSNLYQIFAGRMDVMTLQENGETANINISVENVLIDLERPKTRKLTNEEQIKRHPSPPDNSLRNVATLADRQIAWGR